MKTLETIRESLQKEIEHEVKLKTTVKHAQNTRAKRMTVARSKINDLGNVYAGIITHFSDPPP